MGGVLARNRFSGSLLAFVLLVVTFVVAAPQPALGTTFSVNPDQGCAENGTGPAFCTLEGAVAAAAAGGAGPHTITIAPGTHALSAELNLNFDVSIVGAGVEIRDQGGRT